jgi:hypothetical protein
MINFAADTSVDMASTPRPTKTGTSPPIPTDATTGFLEESKAKYQVVYLKRAAVRQRHGEGPESAAAKLAETTIRCVQDKLTLGRARAIDAVYDGLDPILLAARFDDARVMLIAFAQNELPLAILLSALTVSFPWRATLGGARAELSKKVEQVARQEGGEEKVREIARFL